MQKRTKRIIDSYTNPTVQESVESKIQALDDSVKRSASIKALIAGIAGALLLGIGMCFTMVFTSYFVLGVVIGVAGLIVAGAAYPLYTRVLKKKREAVRPEIMRLASELTK